MLYISPIGVPVSHRRSVAACCWAVTQQCSVLLMVSHSVWMGQALSCMAPTAFPNPTNSSGCVQIHPTRPPTCCLEPTVPRSLPTWNLKKFTPIRHPAMPSPLRTLTTSALQITMTCQAHLALSTRYLAHLTGTTTLWPPTVQIQRVALHHPDHPNPAWTPRHAGEALSPSEDRMEMWPTCLLSHEGTRFQLWRTSSFTEVLDFGNEWFTIYILYVQLKWLKLNTLKCHIKKLIN